jgi:hypothetical protein
MWSSNCIFHCLTGAKFFTLFRVNATVIWISAEEIQRLLQSPCLHAEFISFGVFFLGILILSEVLLEVLILNEMFIYCCVVAEYFRQGDSLLLRRHDFLHLPEVRRLCAMITRRKLQKKHLVREGLGRRFPTELVHQIERLGNDMDR